VIAITAVLFFGWVLFMVFRGIINGIAWLLGAPGRPAMMGPMGLGAQKCPHHGCGQMNPARARFCRRCGRGLVGAQHAQVRRAAVW
jgi:hypothetical protein